MPSLIIGGQLGAELIDLASSLATKNLDPTTVNRAYEEAVMKIRTEEEFTEIFRGTTVWRTASERGLAEGRKRVAGSGGS